MAKVALEPQVHVRLVCDLPGKLGVAARDSGLMRALCACCLCGIEVGEIYVRQRRGRRVPVKMVPDEVANRTCADAPRRKFKFPCGPERAHEPRRARDDGAKLSAEVRGRCVHAA